MNDRTILLNRSCLTEPKHRGKYALIAYNLFLHFAVTLSTWAVQSSRLEYVTPRHSPSFSVGTGSLANLYDPPGISDFFFLFEIRTCCDFLELMSSPAFRHHTARWSRSSCRERQTQLCQLRQNFSSTSNVDVEDCFCGSLFPYTSRSSGSMRASAMVSPALWYRAEVRCNRLPTFPMSPSIRSMSSSSSTPSTTFDAFSRSFLAKRSDILLSSLYRLRFLREHCFPHELDTAIDILLTRNESGDKTRQSSIRE
ncbi:hypothetical protein RvY_03115 [Ramazzottius varieornatus]|uniref:Uncharacterized protein n=1 Tax=Ramazzottius varieornatus TaxID=947166 RepID=A0A1D1UX52_RAMVA|nr:hypothetical protein RvY_03115 [Ramazzottius varieornatus]